MEITFDKAKNTALVTFAAEVPMAGAFGTEVVEVWEVRRGGATVSFGSEAEARAFAAKGPAGDVSLASRVIRHRCPDAVIIDHAKREASEAFLAALAACAPAVPPAE